ncbi:LacI family DNA-binding transcriptional regulator [Psychroflexus salis]|uniref:LacI family transcriptional regulator n=1 Tax=Psychroflexus salis TaxID=1526574 RepID=A0A916ZP70_9FLAO|nr:LacI family DNA-binding transcriptional regulator [Psychroflexus salis]GGE04703.1 LacI family transcriptional regulator [Psychroflexus salis]
MKQITLKEIAASLNVSVTTVSKALKGYKDVNEETKKLIIQKAKELNYKPNIFAVNLRTKESKTIGIIIPEVVHHFFSSVIKGVIAQAEKKGYLVIILQSNESKELEKKQVELLINKRVDGILVSLANETNSYEHFYEILQNEIPLVMFDKIAKLVKCNKVIINDQKAAYNATKHLIDVGCKKIAHFRGPHLPQNSIDRFLGYKKAIDDHYLTYNSKLVYLLEKMTFKEGEYFARKLINEHPDVDGIFVNTDLVAVGAIKAINDLDFNVPNDIAVIGFSNWFMSAVISPSLSTINQPGFEMGKQAFKLLFKEIKLKKKGEEIKPKTIELGTDLIIRESTQKSVS